MKKIILSFTIIFLVFLLTNSSVYAATWYYDGDSDGYGDPDISTTDLTGKNVFFWKYNNNSDCNDSDSSIFPGAPEIAGDGIDQDCDGSDALTWYLDADKDGFGDATKSQDSATKPLGYVADKRDCNDSDSSIFPGAAEIAGDGIDQDCDGSDAAIVFAGVLNSDLERGVAPAAITFYALIAQGTAPFSYNWDFGDGTTTSSGTKTESHTYSTKGSYTAKAAITDATGQTYNLYKTILVTDSTDLDTYQSNLQMDVDQMTQVTKPGDIHGLLFDAQNIIRTSLESIENADAALRKTTRDSVQAKAGELIANTRTKLDEFINNNQTTPADLENISAGLKGVVTSMVEYGLPVLDTTFQKLELISGVFYTQSLDQLLANENLTPAEIEELKTDTTKSQTFFQSKIYLLDNVVDASGIQVDPTPDFDTGEVDSVASIHGLTDKQAAELYNALESTLDVSQTVAVLQKTIAQIAEELFSNYTTGKTVVNSIVEPITQNILLEFSDGTFISFAIINVAIVKDYMPSGLFDLPNGNKIGIADSYAIEFGPYPVYPLDFAAELIKLGINPALDQDGALNLDLSALTTLSLKIGWYLFLNSGFNSLTTSFSVVGGSDPSAEAYSLLVTYDTGLSQLLPPAVLAMNSLTQMMDSIAPADYSIDTDTGVITLGGLKLKPDYTFFALTSIDYTTITATGGITVNNLAFEFADFNSNGLSDIKFYSDDPMGYQILYAVSN
ncbi:MAG: PKD domain-containing protein [Deltaproteobacteria bacterium]|uniref:MopE-related protein n=1 Tax=Desulfobacula sp. TaxID=2593537 RepID=UPI0019A2B9C8|nr:PKD domain-containing protein [Candidatus Desulfobacula maris]MBL6994715.1 PKD domain-containing protein [Desulfobacula sp.]